jgi:hypothetical protein
MCALKRNESLRSWSGPLSDAKMANSPPRNAMVCGADGGVSPRPVSAARARQNHSAASTASPMTVLG